MDEQGAREYKLLDCVEALAKAAQEPARSLDRHHLVLGVGLPGEVVIRREVNNRGDASAEPLAHLCERIIHVLVRGQIHPYRRDPRSGFLGFSLSRPTT